MNEQLRAKLAAKLKAKTPEAPAPVDPEAAALADRLMAQFSRKTTGEPTPAPQQVVENAPSVKTMSLSEPEFQMLRNQKAAESRALAAEKKVANLEATLTHITNHLSQFIMRQQEVLNGCIGNLITDFQRDYAKGELRTIRTVSEIALRLFVSFPQIADTALLNLDVTEEDITTWRKWYAGYKLRDADHWLNHLQDVKDHKANPLPGQAEFFTAALTHDLGAGVMKQRLEAIRQERSRRCERPILVSPRSGTYER